MKRRSTIIMIILFIIGLLILSYPKLSSYINEKNGTKTIYNYENILTNNENIDYTKLKEEANKYNQKLSKLKYPLLTYNEPTNYNQVLNINNEGMIGYITIDKIKVEIPIYHGTSTKTLSKYVGHLQGTSLPIGGKGTHSVLSAHRGLPSSKLFTDLDKLEKGDIFQITILDEVLTYEVDKITIVKPSNTENLAIDKNEDYVTLMTCTPYGINSHRLLVRGKRIDNNTNRSYITTEAIKIDKLTVIPILTIPIILILLIIIIIKPVNNIQYDKYLYPNGKEYLRR